MKVRKVVAAYGVWSVLVWIGFAVFVSPVCVLVVPASIAGSFFIDHLFWSWGFPW